MRSLPERILVVEALMSVTTRSARLRNGGRCQWRVSLIWYVEVRYMRPISEERCTFSSRADGLELCGHSAQRTQAPKATPKPYEHDDGANWPVSCIYQTVTTTAVESVVVRTYVRVPSTLSDGRDGACECVDTKRACCTQLVTVASHRHQASQG